MPAAIQQDEEDVARYGDNYAPSVAPPPNVRTLQSPPVAMPGTNVTQTPDSVIGVAASQLSAGQPVTALPRQSWSFPEQEAFNAKLDAFDRQAEAARIAADQSARDAQMLAQMSRVAKSTKDIEIAMQQQDVMGFRNAVASGVPAVQALTQFPRAASHPLVAAMHAAQPVPEPKWVPPAGGAPGHFVDARGGVHIPAGSEAQMPTPTVEQLGQGVTGVRVSPQRYQVLDKPGKEGALTDVEKARLRSLDSEAHTIKTTLPTRHTDPEYISGTNRLAVITQERDAILSGAGGKQAPTISPVRSAVRNPKTGKWELK